MVNLPCGIAKQNFFTEHCPEFSWFYLQKGCECVYIYFNDISGIQLTGARLGLHLKLRLPYWGRCTTSWTQM